MQATDNKATDDEQTHRWISRCASRLQEQWPTAPEDQLRDTAAELLASEKWRRFAPEVAAVAWLRQGVLAR